MGFSRPPHRLAHVGGKRHFPAPSFWLHSNTHCEKARRGCAIHNTKACHRGGEYTRSIATGRMHNNNNTGSMVTVIQAHKGRLHKSSANGDDDGRVVVTATGTNEQAEHDLLPTSKVARSSSDERVVVAAKKSAELDKTMDTEQLSSLSSSSSSSSSSSISSKKSSPQTNDMPSPGLSPIQRKGSKDGATTNQSTKRPSAPVPQGLVALPVVTRSTRRQTFASAKAPSSKKERKAKSIIGETSPQSTASSSSDDNMMDLFAPPQPVLTRSRQSSAKVTKGNKKAAQDPPSSSPSTSSSKRRKSKASPKTPRDPKTGADAAERKAMSTTNKKQLASSGTLVHIPHPSQGDNFDPFATFHKSPTWAMDAMQTSIESAPARMPVSTQFG